MPLGVPDLARMQLVPAALTQMEVTLLACVPERVRRQVESVGGK